MGNQQSGVLHPYPVNGVASDGNHFTGSNNKAQAPSAVVTTARRGHGYFSALRRAGSGGASGALHDEDGPHLSLSGYDIMKPLGEGSYGKVRIVRQRTTGKYYALKYVDKRHGK